MPDATVDALAGRVRPPRRTPPAAGPGITIDPARVTFEDEREAGPVHVGHQMWRLLQLDTILANAALSRRAQLQWPTGRPAMLYSPEAVERAMTIQQVMLRAMSGEIVCGASPSGVRVRASASGRTWTAAAIRRPRLRDS